MFSHDLMRLLHSHCRIHKMTSRDLNDLFIFICQNWVTTTSLSAPSPHGANQTSLQASQEGRDRPPSVTTAPLEKMLIKLLSCVCFLFTLTNEKNPLHHTLAGDIYAEKSYYFFPFQGLHEKRRMCAPPAQFHSLSFTPLCLCNPSSSITSLPSVSASLSLIPSVCVSISGMCASVTVRLAELEAEAKNRLGAETCLLLAVS